MARALVLTVIGKDRPGLVEALADFIAKHEGHWDESRMARLAGHFAGVVQIHLPENQAEGFMTALPTLADRGLSVSVVDSDCGCRPSQRVPAGAGWTRPSRDRARNFE